MANYTTTAREVNLAFPLTWVALTRGLHANASCKLTAARRLLDKPTAPTDRWPIRDLMARKIVQELGEEIPPSVEGLPFRDWAVEILQKILPEMEAQVRKLCPATPPRMKPMRVPHEAPFPLSWIAMARGVHGNKSSSPRAARIIMASRSPIGRDGVRRTLSSSQCCTIVAEFGDRFPEIEDKTVADRAARILLKGAAELEVWLSDTKSTMPLSERKALVDNLSALI